MTRTVRCPFCRGLGQIEHITRYRVIEMHACRPCAGSGFLSVTFLAAR